ncbi:uncharacterized protein LOC121804156 [Salvia splendens]|uniref:uncharacterized protein LOC121804156 n=1 Tax=Salvia splendens TaxID=180675 RepID=UPI001C26C864|nr:uncharacterized protein LOC121804156 [Salvia splendens]
MASGSGAGGNAGRRINEEMRAYMSAKINRLIQEHLQQQQLAVPRPIHHPAVVPRDHIGAHQRLYNDYFAEQPRFGEAFFLRHFRMRRPLFISIVNALERRYNYFRFREDASGRPGHSPIQKCTAAIRQLAYGGASDMFEEYLHIGETTASECLKHFCQDVIHIFRERYIRKPTPKDCQALMDVHGMMHGFLGILGSTDCMHWSGRTAPPSGKGSTRPTSKARIPR